MIATRLISVIGSAGVVMIAACAPSTAQPSPNASAGASVDASAGASVGTTSPAASAAPAPTATTATTSKFGALGHGTDFREGVAGTGIVFEMVAVPGGAGVAPFHMSRTEVPWELYDVFVYQLDVQKGGNTPATDAVARPTKPYISMDRGFGHAGWPAISMSAHNARKFCEWLSAKTGRTYRLPTLAQWQHAARLSAIPAGQVQEFAWVAENADGTTHKLATRKVDAAGLNDLYGNTAEWVTDASGAALVIGGSYRDAAGVAGPGRRLPDNPDWNASDPQFPKSIWWLADGGFIGVRLVCEDAPTR